MEIMNEANTVINKFTDNENIILAQPIERHGDEVQHWKVDSENNKIIKICEIIKKQLEVGHINIAIIPYSNYRQMEPLLNQDVMYKFL